MQQEHEREQVRDTDASVTVPRRPRLPSPGNRTRLVLASALMLFVELALIRWTSSNNLYLVHMTNFVLLASFLGIGLGFLRAKAGRDLFPLAPVLLAALVALRPGVPGPHRDRTRRPVAAGGAVRLVAAAALAQPDRDLRAHRGDADGARPGGGQDLRHASSRSRPTGSTSSGA